MLCRAGAAVLLAGAGSAGASAQYYELANQLTNVIQPALTGSVGYKGFVELSGTAGLGTNKANFVGLSTSQGFRYASWFFMGAGIGIDAVITPDNGRPADNGYVKSTSATRAMLPLFSDFRFTFGNDVGQVKAFIDLKIGSAWLLGDSWLNFPDGYLSNNAQFFFRPTVGLRIPLSAKSPGQAFNIGVTYQLLTSGNNYYDGWRYGSVTLNNLGVTIGFEW